jgi:pimeloyl-ACP methyl ester carboxylesterase
MLEFAVRNWALISIASTVMLLVVVPWLILRKYVGIALNIVKDTVPPLSMRPCDFSPIEGQVVEFRAFDGIRLQGMFLHGNRPDQPKGMVIFAHEFKSDLYSSARYCHGLLAAGYDVFSFDFRNHGGSTFEDGYRPLQWCTHHELNDILGAIGYVEDWLEQESRPAEIGLFGVSRGGAACLIAARRNPVVKAIIADGAFSTDKIIEHFMRRWASIFAKVRFVYENHPPSFWRFLRWMLFRECRRKLGIRMPSARKAIIDMEKTPIFFIHGEKDGYIPVDQTRMLYAVASDPKYLWIVPGAKHNQNAVVAPAEYASRTVQFFERFLSQGLQPDLEPTPAQEPKNGGAQPPGQGPVTSALEDIPAGSA